MNKKQTRRKFLSITGTVASGLLLSGFSRCHSLEKIPIEKNLSTFGLQLYSLRDVLPQNPKKILKKVAGYGYSQIESYEGPKGMFWGMTNIEFKKYLDDLDLKIISSHCDTSINFEQKAEAAAAIGMQYLIYPWEGSGLSIDAYKKLADDFNALGRTCKEKGIRFAFHNHQYSFQEKEGIIPQDILMQNTNPEWVDFQMDIFWVVAAGQDPHYWLEKYKNRFTLCHIKDRSKNPVNDEGQNSVVLGTGSIDWTKVLPIAKANGMQYYIVEQEAYKGTTSLDAAKENAAYLEKFSF